MKDAIVLCLAIVVIVGAILVAMAGSILAAMIVAVMLYMLEILPIAMLVSGAILASYFDVRTRTIPNEITYSLFAMGLLFSGVNGNLESSMLALTVMIPFLIVLSAIGGMGAGDAKLLLGTAVVLGFPSTLYLLPLIVLVGAVFALGYLLLNRWPVLPQENQNTVGAPSLSFPFAPAILGAVLLLLVSLWWGLY